MWNGTHFPTCLFRKAFSFAVQGLMMLSLGEMYCLFIAQGVVPAFFAFLIVDQASLYW